MTGTTLGTYRILEELGRGGMGIVYKAEDTKLERTVALKVLPAAALASQDDRARFYREAKAAAALNHPNIAAIHQIDEAIAVDQDGNQVEASDGPRPFIAMEFIEGGTLEDRIKAGPLKLDEAVRIATQVAEALKAAHAKDIVHRDIKSANIMLTGDGQAKVLDFGLAQTSASTKLTRMGSTLGTVAYMSPEQARGEEVDGRTDLYSLGTVLYEMVTGKLPFGGEYEQAVVYSILNADPEPLTALRTGVPMELERITNKLLAKDAARRYQSAADLIADLDGVRDQVQRGSGHANVISGIHSGIRPAETAEAPSTGTKPWMLAVAAVLLVAAGWSMASFFAPDSPTSAVERLQVRIDGMRFISFVALSPDERYFALTGYDWDGNEGLFLYDLRDGSLKHVERSEQALYPWFSPSGDRISYSTLDESEMYLVDVPSGTPQKILDNTWTAYWIDEDRLLYTIERESDFKEQVWRRGANYIYSIKDDSSSIVRGTEYKDSEATAQWYFPGPRMPGADFLLGNIQGSSSFGLDPIMYFIDIDGKELIPSEYPGINPQPLSEDILIYQVGDDAGPLVARRFDASTKTFTSPPEDLPAETFFGRFQTNPITGSLLVAETNLPNRQLVSVMDLETRAVNVYELPSESGQVYRTALSEDRRTFVFSLTNGETGLSDIITLDLKTGSQRVILSDVELWVEAITSEGDLYALAYDRIAGSISDEKVLTRRSLFGSPQVDTLSIPLTNLNFGGYSSEGLIVSVEETIGVLDPETRAYTPMVEKGEGSFNLSPDGRYVLYRLPTGVQAVLDLDSNGVTTLPDMNGGWATWSPDGSDIFYLSLDDVPANTREEGDVMRIPVRRSPTFQVVGEPEFLGHSQFPRELYISDQHVIMYGLGEMANERPQRTSAYITWWRNLGADLDRRLPR